MCEKLRADFDKSNDEWMINELRQRQAINKRGDQQTSKNAYIYIYIYIYIYKWIETDRNSDRQLIR